MIYHFRIVSAEVDNFFFNIAIRSTQTFYDLHSCIQDTVNYDSSQLASFFLTNDSWEKQKQITLLDMAVDEDRPLVMDRTILGDYIKEEKQRLLYIFDFFSERGFFMVLEKITEDENGHFPRCTESRGEAPEQIKMTSTKVKSIFEEEEELDEGYDDEDTDLDNIENIDDFEELK